LNWNQQKNATKIEFASGSWVSFAASRPRDGKQKGPARTKTGQQTNPQRSQLSPQAISSQRSVRKRLGKDTGKRDCCTGKNWGGEMVAEIKKTLNVPHRKNMIEY